MIQPNKHRNTVIEGQSDKTRAMGYQAVRDCAVALWMVLAFSLPLFFAGVSAHGVLWFNSVGISALVLWLTSAVLGGSVPKIPRLLLGCVLLLLLFGWTAAFNPSFVFRGAFVGFEPVDRAVAWLPGTIDGVISRNAMGRWTINLLLLCMGVDLCRHEEVRSRVRLSFLMGGLVVIAIAVGQRLSEARSVLGTGLGVRQPFFGTFIYPGSAGAYLNLLFPGFCFELLRSGWRRKLGIAGVFGTCLAWVWNTSRLSSLVGAVELVLFAAILLRRFTHSVAHGRKRFGIRGMASNSGVVLSCVCLLGLLWCVFPVLPLVEKWKMLPDQFQRTYSRLETLRVCAKMAKDSGVWGMGPGTFSAAYPYYSVESGSLTQGTWSHAHCDYMELLIEWGWAGAACWLGMVAGALNRVRAGLGDLGKASLDRTGGNAIQAVAAGGALLAFAMHAFGDFPVFNPSVMLVGWFWLSCAWSMRPAGGVTVPPKVLRGPAASCSSVGW